MSNKNENKKTPPLPDKQTIEKLTTDTPTPQNPPILTYNQLQQGQQLLQQYIKSITCKIKGNKLDITYHWELPTPELAKALAEGIKQQFGGQ